MRDLRIIDIDGSKISRRYQTKARKKMNRFQSTSAYFPPLRIFFFRKNFLKCTWWPYSSTFCVYLLKTLPFYARLYRSSRCNVLTPRPPQPDVLRILHLQRQQRLRIGYQRLEALSCLLLLRLAQWIQPTCSLFVFRRLFCR